jgi:hypothetical protein
VPPAATNCWIDESQHCVSSLVPGTYTNDSGDYALISARRHAGSVTTAVLDITDRAAILRGVRVAVRPRPGFISIAAQWRRTESRGPFEGPRTLVGPVTDANRPRNSMKPRKNPGGVDGTRTRGLRRDRPAL